MWLELELDRLCLSAQRPQRPLPWPSTEEVEIVRALGFVDPVTVRSIPETRPTRYEIVSGEKQWLAAQKAGLSKIAVLVRDGLEDEEVRRVQSLTAEGIPPNPIQEARALQQQVQHGLSVTRAGASRGYSRSVASHLLRLLRLEPTVQQWIAEGTLSVGQTKVLVGLEPKRQLHLARRIRHERLTVRQVEALMRQIRRDPRDPTMIPFDADPRDPDHARFEDRLSAQLGVPVTLEYARAGSGRLILAFNDLEILDGLLERLGYRDAGG
jgi:ParB family chromosome partitioning protein